MADLHVVEGSKPSALEGLVEDYLASCRARGLSPKTIRDNYGYALKSMFLPWAAGEGITIPTTSAPWDAAIRPGRVEARPGRPRALH